MSAEPPPAAEADDLHGAPFAGRHELQRCESCRVSVLRPNPDDLAAVRAGEPLGNVFNLARACQCVGGHQLHRCSTCLVFKVIRADASEQDPRAHRVHFDFYVWAITTAGFLLLFLSLSGAPLWVASAALWVTVVAALAAVAHLAYHSRRGREAEEEIRDPHG